MKKSLSNIGLASVMSGRTATKLNELLANYQLFYMNTRGFHWNITGNRFFEFHKKFEALYTDSLLKIDEIAERILTLGDVPHHTLTAYQKLATIEGVTNVSNEREAVQIILQGFTMLLSQQRELLKQAQSAQDEGTIALMGNYILETEKQIWMYTAYTQQ